jgi:hypothetical protein
MKSQNFLRNVRRTKSLEEKDQEVEMKVNQEEDIIDIETPMTEKIKRDLDLLEEEGVRVVIETQEEREVDLDMKRESIKRRIRRREVRDLLKEKKM